MIERLALVPWQRLAALGLALACLGVLVVSADLDPSPIGHGTHESLGLPACMWAERFDAPCATCGMTTAFALAADGNFVRSFRAQPLGMLLAVGTASLFWLGLYVSATGSSLGVRLMGLITGRALVVLAVAVAAAWAYKAFTWTSTETTSSVWDTVP